MVLLRERVVALGRDHPHLADEGRQSSGHGPSATERPVAAECPRVLRLKANPLLLWAKGAKHAASWLVARSARRTPRWRRNSPPVTVRVDNSPREEFQMFKSSFAFLGAVALGVALSGSPASAQSVMKTCGDQWQAAKAAGTTNGATWPQFLSQCRAQLKTGAAAPSTAAAPAPAAPPPTMHTVPTPPATQTGVAPAPAPAPAGAGEFASEQQARARCPSDTIVWVNNLSHVYHFPGLSSHGRSFYGNTKDGAYMCEADAKAAGDRAAKDERHP